MLVILLCFLSVTDCLSVADHGDRPPHERARKIFLNVRENKSTDRKLCLSPFESSVRCVEYFEGFEDILTPEIGTGINSIALKLEEELNNFF